MQSFYLYVKYFQVSRDLKYRYSILTDCYYVFAENEASSEKNKSLNKELRNDSENEEVAAKINDEVCDETSENSKESPAQSNSTTESNSESDRSSTEHEEADNSKASSGKIIFRFSYSLSCHHLHYGSSYSRPRTSSHCKDINYSPSEVSYEQTSENVLG